MSYETPEYDDQDDFDDDISRIRATRDKAIKALERAEIEVAKRNDAIDVLKEQLAKAEQATAPQVRVVNADASLDPGLLENAEAEFNSEQGRRRTRSVEQVDLRGVTDFNEVVKRINKAMSE